METSSSLRKFQKELKTLFRSEDKDFNWGIYRIMNQKNEEITRFIDVELPKIVEEQIEKLKGRGIKELDEKIKKIVEACAVIKENPEENEEYRRLMKQKKQALSVKDFEDSIYNHLLEFFSRYYQDGDFISQFYFKDDMYLIPYDGSEVSLHWVTKDMYYVKSSDQYQRFSFDTPDKKKIVTFKVSVREEEKGNQKGRDKFFILDEMEWNDDELICSFKNIFETEEISNLGRNKTEKQEKLNLQNAERIKKELGDYADGLDIVKNLVKFQKRYVEDFFIHKNLKGFLLSQMNFYVNQEILHVDSFIDDDGNFNEDLRVIAKVFKDIARNIIEKLDLLETLKKKIWEKKKFILESNYVITLDRIQEFCGDEFLKNLFDKILSNKKQIEEWRGLFGFDIKSINDLIDKKTYDGKIEYKKLPVDTKYFDEEFKWSLLSRIDDLDEKLDGLLIHSENWQALNLLLHKYDRRIKTIYIDPPYNTGSDEFLYKDNYRHSSWLTMMESRLNLGGELVEDTGVTFVSIDDNERYHFEKLASHLFGENNLIGPIIVQVNKGGRDYLPIAKQQEYVICCTLDRSTEMVRERDISKFKYEDLTGRFSPRELRNRNPKFTRENRPNLYYPFFVDPNSKDKDGFYAVSLNRSERYIIEVLPKNTKGEDSCWRWSKEKVLKHLNPDDPEKSEIVARRKKDGGWNIYEKYRGSPEKSRSLWLDSKFRTENGSIQLRNLFGIHLYDFPKPVDLIEELCSYSTIQKTGFILDFFAGSGTTAHAVMLLNKGDEGKRKFILVEMADYFDTVIIPRIKKVAYSFNWKDGKPQDMDGIGVFFKYHKLEQYEDALENIVFKQATLEMFQNNIDTLLRYYLKDGIDINKSKNFLGVDTEKEFLDLSIKILNKDGTTSLKKVDLIETFNYLIGLEIKQMKQIEYNDRPYYIITGKIGGDKTIVIWRDPKNLDKEKDRDFILKQLQEDIYKNIFVNSDCYIQNYKNIYDEMRKRLW